MGEVMDVRVETVVAGAGPAGLAVAACLRRAGRPFVVLERSDRVGSAWHTHYERLHLHTARPFSALPYLPFPRPIPLFPSRRQVIDYLEAYARYFAIQPRFGQRVESLQPSGTGWETVTNAGRYYSENVVIATGMNERPVLPSWPGMPSFKGTIIHSSAYGNGAVYCGQDVLVAGLGNSGGEIAIDLWEHGARPALSVRGPVNIVGLKTLGLPTQLFSILLSRLPPRLADLLTAPLTRGRFRGLERYGVRMLPYGAFTQMSGHGRIPLIDIGTVKLIKQGHLQVYPAIERFNPDGVVFTNGVERRFDAVVLATGYRSEAAALFKQIDPAAVFDTRGYPLVSGKETPIRGLYFCGFQIYGTGMLYGIAHEAKAIAASIAKR